MSKENNHLGQQTTTKRGRPRKYATLEEAHQAKLQQNKEYNKNPVYREYQREYQREYRKKKALEKKQADLELQQLKFQLENLQIGNSSPPPVTNNQVYYNLPLPNAPLPKINSNSPVLSPMNPTYTLPPQSNLGRVLLPYVGMLPLETANTSPPYLSPIPQVNVVSPRYSYQR